MKSKLGMRALDLLLVVALAGAIFVPGVSADEQTFDEKEFQIAVEEVKSGISKDVFEKDDGKQQLSVDNYLRSYGDELDTIVKQAMLSTKTDLSLSEQQTLKELTIDYIISNAKMEKYLTDLGLDEDSATQIYTKDIAEAEGDYTKYPVSVKSGNGDMYTIDFYQCDVDINGGSGYDILDNGYTVNGDNDLYKIHFWNDNEIVYTYQLWYLDEDHPNPLLDATYDAIRYEANDPHTYNDVALFTVQKSSPNTVHLDSCYNGGAPYATVIGIHLTSDRPWTSKIYVSNIWNHDIDVYDANTNMAKSHMSVPYYINMPTT